MALYAFIRTTGSWTVFALLTLLILLTLAACTDYRSTISAGNDEPSIPEGLETLGPIPYPDDNPPVPARIELGQLLFFDPILGGERDVSCGTCHHPDLAFADGRDLPVGVAGSGLGPERRPGVSAVSGDPVGRTPRNSPTVFNTAFNGGPDGRPSAHGIQFWDGRRNGLEHQASAPPTSRVEMRGDAYTEEDAIDSVLARLRAIPEYEARFREAFPEVAAEVDSGLRVSAVDSITYSKALAAYQRELVTRNSAYDRFVQGDESALNETQRKGLSLFFGKARCADCHNGPMFSDYRFVVQGVPQHGPGKEVLHGDDLGREEHTLDPADRYAFRTPTLRNVALTAPYMHDGIFTTLEDVVRFYNDGALPRHPDCTDRMLHPSLRSRLNLSDGEMAALVAFMEALTDPGTLLPETLLRVPERVPSGLPPVFGLGAADPLAEIDMPASGR